MSVLRVVNFGSAKGGLATVGYTVYGVNGVAIGSRITAGVNEIGTSTGIYAASVATPDYDCIVLWDTGEAVPKYSTEDYQHQINSIANETGQIQKIYNSLRNQSEFFSALMERMGLLVKNEGLAKVDKKVEALSQREPPPSLTNIEEAFKRSAKDITISVTSPEYKVDYADQFSGIIHEVTRLKDEVKGMNKKDYTGHFSSLIDLLKTTQKSIDKSLGDKAVGLAREIQSLRSVFARFDDLLTKINSLESGMAKSKDKEEVISAIKELNSFIKRLGMTQQDLSILQAFGHKR